MNSTPVPKTSVLALAIAFIGTFLIVAGLIWIMYYFTQPPPVDQARAAERRKNLADLNAQTKEQLDNYGWIDQPKGIVRLPITRAMELTLQEWQNPAVAHSNLVVRVDKATAVPTNAPAAVNPYE